MANEQLVTILELDERGYVKGSRTAGRAAKGLVDDMDAVQQKARRQASAMGDFGYSVGSFMRNAAITGAQALGVLDAAIVGAGIAASRKAADFEALELALVAIEGSAGKAKDAISELRDIAKGPGLGVEEAIGTYAGLRRGGVDKSLAMDLTRGTGNAVATAGGGKEQLGRAGLAMSQIATKPFLQGEELMQLTEAGIPAYKIIKELFNTSDTEELKRNGITSMQVLKAISDYLGKTPKVAGGAKNAWENLGEAADQAVISFGHGINSVLVPALNGAADIFDMSALEDIKSFGTEVATSVKNIFENLNGGVVTAKGAMDSLMFATIELGVVQERLAKAAHDTVEPIARLVDALESLVGKIPWRDLLEMTSKPIDVMTGGFAYQIRKAIFGDPNGGKSISEETGSRMDLMKSRSAVAAGAAAGASFMGKEADTPSTTKTELPKQTNYLREIATNTKASHDLMVGGGAVTSAAINARNLGAWTGSQSKAHGFAAQMVNAIYNEVHQQFIQAAKQRHFSPGSI